MGSLVFCVSQASSVFLKVPEITAGPDEAPGRHTEHSTEDSWNAGVVYRPCFLVLSPMSSLQHNPLLGDFHSSKHITVPTHPPQPLQARHGLLSEWGVAQGWARAVVLESETTCVSYHWTQHVLLVPRRVWHLKHSKGVDWSQCQTWGTGAFFADQ